MNARLRLVCVRVCVCMIFFCVFVCVCLVCLCPYDLSYPDTVSLQVRMQDFMTVDVVSMCMPTGSVNLTPESPCVAAGGAGRVFRCELTQAITSPQGDTVARGTVVVRRHSMCLL